MKSIVVGLMFFILSCSTPEGKVPTQPVFDIPSLIGKDIDQVKRALGEPPEEYPPDLKKDIGYLSYLKEGWALSITYRPTSRKVMEYFIHAVPVQRFKKSNDLLVIGSLDANAFAYVAVPGNVEGDTTKGYTDVTVYPRY